MIILRGVLDVWFLTTPGVGELPHLSRVVLQKVPQDIAVDSAELAARVIPPGNNKRRARVYPLPIQASHGGMVQKLKIRVRP